MWFSGWIHCVYPVKLCIYSEHITGRVVSFDSIHAWMLSYIAAPTTASIHTTRRRRRLKVQRTTDIDQAMTASDAGPASDRIPRVLMKQWCHSADRSVGGHLISMWQGSEHVGEHYHTVCDSRPWPAVTFPANNHCHCRYLFPIQLRVGAELAWVAGYTPRRKTRERLPISLRWKDTIRYDTIR